MKTTITKMKNTLEGKTIFSHSCVHLAKIGSCLQNLNYLDKTHPVHYTPMENF